MNKTIIIGIIIFVVIGAAFAVVQLTDNDDSKQVIVEKVNSEPKSYTVELSDSIGITQDKP